MMTKVFEYGFEKDEFIEILIKNGHYNAEAVKIGKLWIVTW